MKKLPALDESKVRDKADVSLETHVKKTSIQFTTLMDLCHLKHPELTEHLHEYKGRVVLGGDSVKDD